MEKMLTLKEAAGQLGYSPSGLRKFINRTKAGKAGTQIQFFQAGAGRIKFRREWLDEFVLANSIEPGQVQPRKSAKRRRHSASTERVEIEPHWNLAS